MDPIVLQSLAHGPIPKACSFLFSPTTHKVARIFADLAVTAAVIAISYLILQSAPVEFALAAFKFTATAHVVATNSVIALIGIATLILLRKKVERIPDADPVPDALLQTVQPDLKIEVENKHKSDWDHLSTTQEIAETLVSKVKVTLEGNHLLFDLSNISKPSPRCLLPLLLGCERLQKKLFSVMGEPTPEVPHQFYVDLSIGKLHLKGEEFSLPIVSKSVSLREINALLFSRVVEDYLFAYIAEERYIRTEQFPEESFSLSLVRPKYGPEKVGFRIHCQLSDSPKGVLSARLTLQDIHSETARSFWGTDRASELYPRIKEILGKIESEISPNSDFLQLSDVSQLSAQIKRGSVTSAGVIALDEQGNVLRGDDSSGHGYAGGGGALGLGYNPRFAALSEMAHEINVSAKPEKLILLKHHASSKNASYLALNEVWFTPDKPFVPDHLPQKFHRGKKGIHPCGPVIEFTHDFFLFSFPHIRTAKLPLRELSHDIFDYLEYEQKAIQEMLGKQVKEVTIGGAESHLDLSNHLGTGPIPSEFASFTSLDCPARNKIRTPGTEFGVVSLDFHKQEETDNLFEAMQKAYALPTEEAKAFCERLNIWRQGTVIKIGGFNPLQIKALLSAWSKAEPLPLLQLPKPSVPVYQKEFPKKKVE